jgi:hypothetical protein
VQNILNNMGMAIWERAAAMVLRCLFKASSEALRLLDGQEADDDESSADCLIS